MVLRYGKQLHKIITDAIEGEDAEELGPKIFDLSDKGCNLKIKVEQQGDYPTYVSSKFATPKAIEGLDKSKIDDIYKNIIDLESVFTVKSYDELTALLNEHYFCNKTEDAPTATPKKEPQTSSNAGEDLLEDDTVKKLLEGIE